MVVIMYFESFSDLLAMGGTGHAKYIWSCYAITFALLAYNIWQPMAQRKKIMSDLARKLKRDAQIQEQMKQPMNEDNSNEASA